MCIIFLNVGTSELQVCAFPLGQGEVNLVSWLKTAAGAIMENFR